MCNSYKCLQLTVVCSAALVLFTTVTAKDEVNDVIVLAVATYNNDGYKRFIRSAEIYDLPVKTLGMGTDWEGGSMAGPGGGHKINIMKEELVKYKDDPHKIILFTDSFDVVYLKGLKEILSQFKKIGGRVVFSAEHFCWPDRSLASAYPEVSSGKRYLNSGGFIGYAPEIYTLFTHKSIENSGDDQLFFTEAYLNESLRNFLQMKLDHKSQIFQNLNGVADEVELVLADEDSYVENIVTHTFPAILHANGDNSVKCRLNHLGNYVPRRWTKKEGCISCKEDVITLSEEVSGYPVVFLAIIVSKPTPFLEEFFRKIGSLNYPKSKIILFLYNTVEYHERNVEDFNSEFGGQYKKVIRMKPGAAVDEMEGKTMGMQEFRQTDAKYYFNVDSEAHLDNPNTLKLLIEQNRSIIAPMLPRPYKSWTNFWGDVLDNGYYKRSEDYMDIAYYDRQGLWNVPHISSCYLIQGSIVRNHDGISIYQYRDYFPDMAFSFYMRHNFVFMYVSNVEHFGHLVNPDDFDISRKNPDFYEILENKWDWQQRYIHEDYSENLNPDKKPMQPCPDVYWFPVATPRFCRELIEIMETYGKWSNGSNQDSRVVGGYENVPTRDIHMKQVGLESQWLYFLKEYVRPLQEKTFTGYYHDDDRLDGGYEAVPTRDIHMNQVGLERQWLYFLEKYVSPLNQHVFTGYQDEPPRAIMNFVVRYKPDEQPFLRPHHDSSTYTINIALNRAGQDYEGGGCRFLRYNCSVTDTRLGWMLMHPGRLTHYHEGLPVTKGTRYIMISFVDP